MDIHKTTLDFEVPLVHGISMLGGRIPYTNDYEVWTDGLHPGLRVAVQTESGEAPIQTCKRVMTHAMLARAADMEATARHLRDAAMALHKADPTPDWMKPK